KVAKLYKFICNSFELKEISILNLPLNPQRYLNMKKLRIFILILFCILISHGYKINAQSNAGELKDITLQLKEIVTSNSFLYRKDRALQRIKKGKTVYLNSNEKEKLKKQYVKFLEAESQAKETVKALYLNQFESDKKNLLAETIPGSPRGMSSEAA